jgi:hypothetical protein
LCFHTRRQAECALPESRDIRPPVLPVFNTGPWGAVAAQGRGRPGDMPGTTKKAHQAERLLAIRLRYCINTHLDEQGLTAAPDIARAVGLPQAEAVRLLTRRQWRDGDVAALQAVADRLGLDVPLDGLGLSAREGKSA